METKCRQGHVPSGGSREESFLAASGGSRHSLWLHHSDICLCLLFSFLLSTLVIGFRAYLGNPGCSYLKILNLIKSMKTLSSS